MRLTMEMCADALMIYSLWLLQRACPVLQLPHTFPSLRPFSPPPRRLWSIRPSLPVPHVIFFSLWHSSPLLHCLVFWGMHARSQIYQLWSECCTMVGGNGGMEKVEKGSRKDERGQVSGLPTSFQDQRLANGKERVGEEESNLDPVEGRKRAFYFSGAIFCSYPRLQTWSLSEEFLNIQLPSPHLFWAGGIWVCVLYWKKEEAFTEVLSQMKTAFTFHWMIL